MLIAYVAALFGISRIILGKWLPPTSEKGLWFYSGLAALLLGNLLVAPFFTKPADALANAVAALIALLAVDVLSSQQYTGFDRFLWYAATAYAIFVLASSIISIALKDSPGQSRRKFAKALFILCGSAGNPRAVFSAVFMFALIAFHRQSSNEYVGIGLAWFLLVGLRPLEGAMELGQRLWDIIKARPLSLRYGEVVAHQTPGIVLVRLEEDSRYTFGTPVVARAEDGKVGLAMALDHIGYVDARWLRALHLSIDEPERKKLEARHPAPGSAAVVGSGMSLEDIGLSLASVPEWGKRSLLIGLVAPETSMTQLRMDVVRTDLDLEAGRLLEVRIAGTDVLCQLMDGINKEEILFQKNTRGYVLAHAKMIGHWNADKARFETVRWVPHLNSPVYLVDCCPATPLRDAVGHFPGTDYPVTVDVDSLVTHNAAILGILGSGKSCLALELVERMIAQKIKVICFDLTDQYAQELAVHRVPDEESKVVDELRGIGNAGKDKVNQNVEEGGSALAFKKKVHEQLAGFLGPSKANYLRIYNPVTFEVWRQDSKPYQGKASMASLTPTEVTRIFTEAALEVAQSLGMTDRARCCLVFEEAHSIIPEWSATASEGDRSATNGTAKAILQGRKFGLGCLVITQRTANVTKSILDQCNTIFALRVFDATGMEFLKNYVGEDCANVLSTLADRHAVVFGKASSCRDPVLVRLNDRDVFLRQFRGATSAPAATQQAAESGPG